MDDSVQSLFEADRRKAVPANGSLNVLKVDAFKEYSVFNGSAKLDGLNKIGIVKKMLNSAV